MIMWTFELKMNQTTHWFWILVAGLVVGFCWLPVIVLHQPRCVPLNVEWPALTWSINARGTACALLAIHADPCDATIAARKVATEAMHCRCMATGNICTGRKLHVNIVFIVFVCFQPPERRHHIFCNSNLHGCSVIDFIICDRSRWNKSLSNQVSKLPHIINWKVVVISACFVLLCI